MTEFTRPSGLASITDECSGGYSFETTIPNKAKDRNTALNEALKELLEMKKQLLCIQAQFDALEAQREACLCEARVHASELDTYKGILADISDLLGLRSHDYHIVSKIKSALAARDLENKVLGIQAYFKKKTEQRRVHKDITPRLFIAHLRAEFEGVNDDKS